MGRRQPRRPRRERSVAPPIWPGMEGGRYKPLTDGEVDRIHDMSLDLLENVGVAEPTSAWRDRVVDAGGWMKGERLCFPPELVERCIESNGRGFVLRGRTAEHDLDVSGTRTHFGGASTTVQILDSRTNEFRDTTLLDLYDASRLQDSLDTMHFVNRAIIPRDIPPDDVDLNMAYALMVSTNKHLIISFHRPESVAPTVRMFDMSLGGDGSGERWRARPFAMPIVTAVVSPMRFAPEACEVLDEAVRHGMPVTMCTAPLAGATGPASIAGTLAQGNAETLAGIVALNLLAPGHEIFMGNVPFIADLRTGSFMGGSGEAALLGAGAAQMANHYDIPSWIANGITASNQPDVQSGWEKGYLVALVALAGGSLLSQSAGALSNLISSSLEAFLLDADLVGGVQRTVRGFEVSDETLSVDVIESAVMGEGHYLGDSDTLQRMQSDFVYPDLADRRSIEEWTSSDDQDLRAWARRRLEAIMQTHHPQVVAPEDDARIRETFTIHLPESALHPGDGRW